MIHDARNPLKAILPLLYYDDEYWLLDNGKPTVAKIGTVFFVDCNQETYAITASHCLNNAKPKNIFIALQRPNPKALPISAIIKSQYNDGLCTDTEITVLKMPLVEELCDKVKDLPYKLAQQAFATPYLKRQIRLFRKGKISLMNILNSSFYRNLKAHEDKIMRAALENVMTEDLNINTLKVADNTDIPLGAKCCLCGYPKEKFDIKTDSEGQAITSNLCSIPCFYKGTNMDKTELVFEYAQDINLDGCSGGPVLYKNRVIGMAHSVKTALKELNATPLTTKFLAGIPK